jgi:hypothetical protein
MKGFLLRGIGQIACSIGFLGSAFWLIRNNTLPWENPFSLPFFLLLVVGFIIFKIGSIFYYTKESGLWKEIYEKTSIWEKLTGNVPILKYEKVSPPLLRRRTGLIIGISMMTVGGLAFIIIILIKSFFLKSFLIPYSIAAFIIGLLFVIFSIAYLDKGA